MLNIAESVRCSCWALISVCGAIPATQSQCGKSRGCHYHQHQPRRRPHPYCHHWQQCHHHRYLTNGRRHSVAKLTSFADWVFAAFWILTVYQTVWKETKLIKHHDKDIIKSHLCHCRSCRRTSVRAEYRSQVHTTQSHRGIPRPSGRSALCRCRGLRRLHVRGVFEILKQIIIIPSHTVRWHHVLFIMAKGFCWW